MFLILALLILALGVGLFLNVYASFFPFLQSIGHITDYNVAYYSAISAVERGMLTTKYRLPGFVGSGGVLDGTGRGPLSDQYVFFVTGNSQGNRWTVNSRTDSIPGSGEGNVDPFLSTGDSIMYNTLRYGESERILLSVDNTSDPEQYYSGNAGDNVSGFDGGSFSGEIRLPPFVVANFATGGNDATLCGNTTCDNVGITDEAKINRGMRGIYQPTLQGFSILPTIGIFYYSGMQVNSPYDNAIRVSLFDPTTQSIHLQTNGFTFVDHGTSLSGHNMISYSASIIQNSGFQDILGDTTDFSNLQFSLGLVSLLRTQGGAIYPYLEYRLQFPQPIADRFYTIDGHGRNRDYDVQIEVKKPTVQGTVGGDFTVIF